FAVGSKLSAAAHDPLIFFLPIKAIFPALLGPHDPHLAVADSPAVSCSLNFPASALSMERNNRWAFAGLGSRCRVSMMLSYSCSERTTTERAFWRVTRSGARSSQTCSMYLTRRRRKSVYGTWLMGSSPLYIFMYNGCGVKHSD